MTEPSVNNTLVLYVLGEAHSYNEYYCFSSTVFIYGFLSCYRFSLLNNKKVVSL